MTNKEKQTRQTQMYALVKEWHKSKLSRYRFSKQHNLSYSTFDYWVRKYEKDKKGNNPFLPVRISAPQSQSGITITYPNGVQLSMSGQIDTQTASELINSWNPCLV